MLAGLPFPDFYNWNKVKVRYCDGSSFTGDVERVDPVSLTYLDFSSLFIYLFFPVATSQ